MLFRSRRFPPARRLGHALGVSPAAAHPPGPGWSAIAPASLQAAGHPAWLEPEIGRHPRRIAASAHRAPEPSLHQSVAQSTNLCLNSFAKGGCFAPECNPAKRQSPFIKKWAEVSSLRACTRRITLVRGQNGLLARNSRAGLALASSAGTRPDTALALCGGGGLAGAPSSQAR